jgi:hypothetical protein
VRRSLLVAAGAAVVALIIFLLVSLRTADAPRPAGPAPTPPPVREAAPTPVPAPTAAPAPPPTPEPARPIPIEPPPTVRDHRDDPASAGPPSPLSSPTIATIRQALEPQIRACAPYLKDQKPARIVVSAEIHAAGGRVTARNVNIPEAETLGVEYVSCITRAYDSLSTDAPSDQTDGHDLVHMPWSIP